jgi:ubiquinol-cytochrome c reductase subunit 9
MGLASFFYQSVAKRTSTLVLTMVGGALVFERGFDSLADYIWETHNKGKLWKDIKGKYESAEE